MMEGTEPVRKLWVRLKKDSFTNTGRETSEFSDPLNPHPRRRPLVRRNTEHQENEHNCSVSDHKQSINREPEHLIPLQDASSPNPSSSDNSFIDVLNDNNTDDFFDCWQFMMKQCTEDLLRLTWNNKQ